MWRTLLILLAVLAVPSAASASSLVSVHAPEGALERLGLDVTHDGSVVLHDAGDRAALDATGYPYTTLVEDLEAASRAARRVVARGPSPLPSGRTSYRALADYESELDGLIGAHAGLVREVVLGESEEGRRIRGVEIAANVNDDASDGRPAFALFGLHHAREWPSGEIPVEFARELAEGYGSDDRITALLDAVRVFVVPVVNPDGFVHSQIPGNEMWRKNSPARGVDLNRNYGAAWGGVGADAAPGSDIYRGPAPFSELESQAVHAFSQTHQLTNVQSIHNIYGAVLRQPGFRAYGDTTPDEPRMKALGDAMAAASGYDSDVAWGIGEITGATEDWNYIAQGAFGYTIELGPAISNAFQGTYATHVVAQYPGTRDALLLAAEQAADERDHAVLTGSAAPGSVLRVRREFFTSTLCASSCGGTGAQGFADFVETSLTVPASGRFAWHVGPSTRPWSPTQEAWTLTCTDATGAERARREVVAGRGQTVDVGDACAPPPAAGGGLAQTPPGGGSTSTTPAPPRAVPASRPRLSVARLRVRRSTLRRRRALSVPLRLSGGPLRDVRLSLRRAGRTVASRRIARVARAGRVRLPLKRIPGAGTYRLSVRGLSTTGAVTASATVQIRR